MNSCEEISKADARIVRAVRKLRSTKEINSSSGTKPDTLKKDLMEDSKNPMDLSETPNKSNKPSGISEYEKISKQGGRNINTTRTQKESIVLNCHNKITPPFKNRASSLSKESSATDVLGVNKPGTGSSSGSHLTPLQQKRNHPYDYNNLRRVLKNKTEYQKNIMSPNNIEKYKAECLTAIKNDKKVLKLFEDSKILEKTKMETYLEENFFSQFYFLYKLEILILNDIQESNTLKVFRVNPQKLPFKKIKENFYKEEISRDLKRKIYDINYKNKLSTLLTDINKHIENIKNFEI